MIEFSQEEVQKIEEYLEELAWYYSEDAERSCDKVEIQAFHAAEIELWRFIGQIGEKVDGA